MKFLLYLFWILNAHAESLNIESKWADGERMAMAVVPPPPLANPIEGELSSFHIVLDPGHGGKDPGALFYGLKEKQLTLDIANRVKRLLEKEGARVSLTRDNDAFIDTYSRGLISRILNTDAFVSIHLNSGDPKKDLYTSVWIWKQEEKKKTFPTYAKTCGEQSVCGTRLQSLNLANAIARSLHARLDLPFECPESLSTSRFWVNKNGVGHDDYVVLRTARPDKPAVLVEATHGTNPNEAKKLRTAKYRQALAESIFIGIKKGLLAKKIQIAKVK